MRMLLCIEQEKRKQKIWQNLSLQRPTFLQNSEKVPENKTLPFEINVLIKLNRVL